MCIRRISAIVLSAALLLCLFSGCGILKTGQNPKTKTLYGYFDTVTQIISYAKDSKNDFNANTEAVSSLLEEYHRLFDIYNDYSGINNLKTVNDNAGKTAIEVDIRIIELLTYAKEIHRLTDGATNVAMGSVLSLWHVEREKASDDPDNAALPSKAALDEASKHTDIDKIIIDRETQTVYISDPLLRIDVGAIGKGYAAEKAAELLISRGVTSYVIDVGGNLRAIGEKAPGEGWVTGITNPDKKSDKEFICKVTLKNGALVTSGDYERFYTVSGKDYHHIIDPKTNMPASFFSSVSVFAEDSALADALSTALFCMSYEDGLAVISALSGVDAVWVGKDGELLFTPGVSFI